MSSDPYLMLRERVTRAERARVLMDDDLFNAVLEQVEHDAVNQWRAARGPTSLSTREHSHAVVVGIDAIKGQLRMLIDDGSMARSEIDQLDETEQEQ